MALTLTGTENDRVICLFTFTFCTEKTIFINVAYFKYHIFIYKNVEKPLLWEQHKHTFESEPPSTCLPCTFSAPELAIGVTGNECAAFVDEGNKILLSEWDLEVEGLLSKGPLSDDKVSETIKTLFSESSEQVFVLKLLSESKFFIEDLTLVECGLGGSPLVEPGLDNVGPSVLVEDDNALSSVLVGICRDERLGLLDCEINKFWSLFPFLAMSRNTSNSKLVH